MYGIRMMNGDHFPHFKISKQLLLTYGENLKYVFPAYVGCGLLELQRMGLRNCNLEVMIAKEKDGVNASFQFPKLMELELSDLKDMSLYEGPHTFDFPKLKCLHIESCSNMSFEKFIPTLEELKTDEQGFRAMCQCADFSVEFCSKLKKVTLFSLKEEMSVAMIFGFLSRIKSLEMVVLDSCSLEDVFRLDDPLNQSSIGDVKHNLLSVKHMELQSVRKLKHIIKKDSQVNRILEHIHTLKIKCCDDMMNIAPSFISLQNLTTLHVEQCCEVTNLVTASTAKTMVHLKEMRVVNCSRIEEIVAKDGDSTEHDVIIFNKLQRLELTNLRYLNSFCSNKYLSNFPLLEQVNVSSCSRMNIFCGGILSTPKLRGILFEGVQQWEGNLNSTITSQLREWVGENLEDARLFQNVNSLEVMNNTISSKAVLSFSQMKFLNKLRDITVRDCDLIQVVFDLEGLSAVGGYIGLLPELTRLKLINLPMLTQLCNKAPTGILDFNTFRVLKIDNCRRLEYALTWSMASCLSQLQRVDLKNCEMMKTLIVDEEDAAARTIFNNLENVVLENMPKFSSIYSGSGDLECPSLKMVTARECPTIKALFISTHGQSANPVLPKLEKLSMDIKSIKGMMQCEAPSCMFAELKVLELKHCSTTAKSHVPLVRFLSRLPNLDQLEFRDSSFKELFNGNTEEPPTMPRINSLMLYNLHDLNNICWQASLFPSLESLEVMQCGKLVNLASSSASFQNLITLRIFGCNQLMNLITPSVARTMVQLKKLKVSYCRMLMEIVGHGSDQTTDEIVFNKLESLELASIPSLEGFSLTHYNFKFPCLDKVILSGCPNLRIFCHGIINTPRLNSVESWVSYWERDLNTTTKHLYQKMVGIECTTDIKLSAFPLLKEKWKTQFPISFSPSLERLEVDNSEVFPNAIPSHLLQHLYRLKVLIVEKCDSVEQVIGLEGLNANNCGINQMKNLEELQLNYLPRLKKVWGEDPQQILSFKKLQVLKVYNCGSLTYIFDLSMALSLKKLQFVEVKNCSLVEHIIMIAEKEITQKYQTIFPSLQSMNLQHLTNLLSFCSTSGVLECRSLKNIEVVDCPAMDLFTSTFSVGQESSVTFEEKGESVSSENPDSVTAFLGNKVVIPGLEELKVEWKTLKDALVGIRQSGLLSGLKCIELTGFQDEECAVLPLTYLLQCEKLEKLAVGDALIEEINLDDLSILKDKDPKFLPLLTKLKLSKLPNLKHLVCHDCQPIRSLKYLVDLELVECKSLKILGPPSVSFHNLTNLEVSKCDGLIKLISASTARSLVQLRRMNVKDCKMMQEVVAIADDGEEYEIRFSQLEYLGLDGLPCLKSFCSAYCDFDFPSLEEVMVTRCSSMKNFAEKVSGTPKLRKVRTGQKEYEWEWEGSLNDTIQALYMERDAEEKAAQNIPQEQIE